MSPHSIKFSEGQSSTSAFHTPSTLGEFVTYVPKLDVMKHLMTLVALLVSTAAVAQIPTLPWNPDENGDQFIGLPDLLGLLTVYGQEFENAIVAEDGESAIMEVGTMNWFECEYACENLPGFWKMSKSSDLVPVMPISSGGSGAWVQVPNKLASGYSNNEMMVTFVDYRPRVVRTYDSDIDRTCYCTAKQLPRVEYSHCSSTSVSFSTCVEQKVSEGWYPLNHGPHWKVNNSSSHYTQAFWRFAQ